MSFVAAAELFDREQMEALLNEGADINEQNELGDTAMHICLAREDFVEFLLSKKASLNVQNNMGSTCLHKAAAMNNGRLIQTLLKNKADANIQNKLNFYPEAYANYQKTFNTLIGSHKKEVTVPLHQKSGLVIGRKGSTLQKIRVESGAFIEIPKNAPEACAVITGRPECVAAAKEKITAIIYPKKNQQRMDDMPLQGTMVKCPINKQYHGRIIGKRGATLKQIQSEFNVKVMLPKQNDSSNVVEVYGEIDNIEKAVRRIHELAKNQNYGGNNSGDNQPRRNRTPNSSRPIPQKTSNTLPINHR